MQDLKNSNPNLENHKLTEGEKLGAVVPAIGKG